jgi:murein DD-endopeptidase MepM/ murein hydrolase activator NlpD
MRSSWITAAGLGLLCIAAPPRYAVAAPPGTTPATTTPPASKKAPTPKKVKKTKPVVARKKAAPVPMKPPADIPVVTEAASVWEGCLESRDVPQLASRLGIEETRLSSLLTDEELFGNAAGGDCIQSVAVTGGESGVASATFQRSGNSNILALRKTADGVTLTPGACDCQEPQRRVFTLAAHDVADPLNEVLWGLPLNVRWQFDILVPALMARVAAQEAATFPEADSLVGSARGADRTDAYSVRVVLNSRDASAQHLDSIEVLESATGKRVDGVWWLDRPDGPGVFIGTEGLVYERLLWESPIKYVQKSRGVGPALNSYRRKVAAPKGSKGPATVVRTFFVKGYHLGVDMVAPKGTEVHAVGDATVSFAGRLGGFGNLIILDHGRGYQTYYAHLSRIGSGVKPGAQVAGGEIIGLVGSTGYSTAPHLHFETRKDAKYLDPFDETRQLDFWLLTADDQERLATRLLSSEPASAHDWTPADKQDSRVSDDNR